MFLVKLLNFVTGVFRLWIFVSFVVAFITKTGFNKEIIMRRLFPTVDETCRRVVELCLKMESLEKLSCSQRTFSKKKITGERRGRKGEREEGQQERQRDRETDRQSQREKNC